MNTIVNDSLYKSNIINKLFSHPEWDEYFFILKYKQEQQAYHSFGDMPAAPACA
jgi:hypothetical protein